jgi:hypothetical protein
MLYKKTIKEYYSPPGTLCMNQALFLRLLEYVKENNTLPDTEIHKLVETAVKWSHEYDTLTMEAYQSIITGVVPA